MAKSVRLAGSGTDPTVGGVTNASKVVNCAPTLKALNCEKLVFVRITSPFPEAVNNCPEFES
jgi:hypothetical protein